MAFFYYWIVVACTHQPRCYNFNSHVEHHAYETYNAFLGEYEEYLKAQIVPL